MSEVVSNPDALDPATQASLDRIAARGFTKPVPGVRVLTEMRARQRRRAGRSKWWFGQMRRAKPDGENRQQLPPGDRS